MKHTARTPMAAAEVIGAIDGMPKERGGDFYAGKMVAGAVNRTYTRVDGDRFQVSRTAGMGSPVVVSGKVTDDGNGGAVVSLTTTFGLWPLGTFLVVGILLLALGVYFVYAREFFYAATSAVASTVPFGWYRTKSWDARYLRSELSKYLGGISWVPDS